MVHDMVKVVEIEMLIIQPNEVYPTKFMYKLSIKCSNNEAFIFQPNKYLQ